MEKKTILNAKSGIKNFGLTTSCVIMSLVAVAQDKTYPIKTSAKPDFIKAFNVGETDGNINLLFTKKGKKHEIYTNYMFDKSLNLITETEEEMDVEQAKKKTITWRGTGFTLEGSRSGIIRDSVLSVENNMLGKLVIMTGYIGWTTQKHPMDHNKEITSQGFVYREKITPKDETTGRRLTMVGFQTDAPAEFFSTGKSAKGNFATNMRRMGSGGDKRVSSSSGDVMVVSFYPAPKNELTGERKIGHVIYLAQRYSAKTLQKIAETSFEFKHSTSRLYNQQATDESNDMLLIFTPTHGAIMPKTKTEYEYFRIGVDTKIKERVIFNSPHGRLNNLYIHNTDDETIIMGTSKAGNEGKFADFVAFKGNDDQLVIIRIKNGQTPVVKATPIKDLGIELSRFTASDALKNADNKIWITGQEFTQKDADPAKWGKIYAFNIETDGRVAKLLTLPQIEKTSEKSPSPISLVKLDANGERLLWSAYEITKKGNMYPKYAKINSQDLDAVVFPGNKQYVVNDKFPMYISPDKKELIYFGNTEDDKQLWLHKEGL